MPGFIPVPDAYSVDFHYTLAGQNVHNIWDVAPLDPGGSFSIPDVQAAFATWYSSDMKDSFSADLVLQDITMKSLAVEDAPGVVYLTGMPIAGARSTESLPNNVAVCVSLKTLLSGRSHQGRKYFGGICKTDVVRSTIDTTLANQIVSSVNNLKDTLEGDHNCMLVVVSKRFGGADRTTGIYTQINHAQLHDYILDSQRRRLPGRGT